jgi:hypothetical protein
MRNLINLIFGYIGTPAAIIINIDQFLEYNSLITFCLSIGISILVIIYWITKIKYLRKKKKLCKYNNNFINKYNQNEN